MSLATKIKFGVVAFLVVFIGLPVLFGTWYTVDQGERAVVLRNGAVLKVAEPGWHWMAPLVDSVVKLPVQDRKISYTGMAAYSRDQQPATLTVTVNYRLSAGAMAEIYANYGSEQAVVDRLLTPRVNAETKNVFGLFNAVAAIQERGRLNQNIAESIQAAVGNDYLVLGDVNVEEIDFSLAYEESIEARMLAEVEVEKVKQNLEREQVQAEIVQTQAAAQAFQVREIGQAEADAIRARGEALRDSPDLIKLVTAEKWNGTLPTTMLPNGAIPFIDALAGGQ